MPIFSPQRRRKRKVSIKRLWSAREVAEYLDLNVVTVYEWAQKGKLPATRMGWNWRFRQEDIDKWLDQQKHGEQVEKEHESTC